MIKENLVVYRRNPAVYVAPRPIVYSPRPVVYSPRPIIYPSSGTVYYDSYHSVSTLIFLIIFIIIIGSIFTPVVYY
jgi:hypothetical protein